LMKNFPSAFSFPSTASIHHHHHTATWEVIARGGQMTTSMKGIGGTAKIPAWTHPRLVTPPANLPPTEQQSLQTSLTTDHSQAAEAGRMMIALSSDLLLLLSLLPYSHKLSRGFGSTFIA